MYKTSRKGESDNGSRGRDSINSRRVDRRVKQERQVSMKQNELDMEQLSLIEDLSRNIVENGQADKLLKYKDSSVPLSEDELYSLLPKGKWTTRISRNFKNPLFMSALLLTVLSSILTPVDAYHINLQYIADKVDTSQSQLRGLKSDISYLQSQNKELQSQYKELQTQNAILMEQNRQILQILQNPK